MIKRVWMKKNIAAYEFSGKLSDEDYQSFVPQIESMLNKHSKMRLMIIFNNFEGWDLKALWQNIVFDFKNKNSFEKIAFTGQNKLEYWIAALCKAFTTARVKYFATENAEEALKWLEQDLSKEPVSEPVVTPY